MLELSETSCSDIFFGEIYYLGIIAIECLEAGDIAGAMLFKKEFWHRIAFFEKLKPDFRRIAKKRSTKVYKKEFGANFTKWLFA